MTRHRTRRRAINGRLIDRPASPCPARPGRLRADTRVADQRQRSHEPRVQATRIRPDTRPTDLRRLAAAALSAVIPGLGQLFNRRPALALLFLVPSLVVLGIGLLLVQLQSPARLAAWVVVPAGPGHAPGAQRLAARLAAARRRPGLPRHPPDRADRAARASSASLVIALVVAIPHLVVCRYGTILGDTFAKIFAGRSSAPGRRGRDGRPGPGRRRADQRPAGRRRQARRPGRRT